jgi:hypothetical protein
VEEDQERERPMGRTGSGGSTASMGSMSTHSSDGVSSELGESPVVVSAAAACSSTPPPLDLAAAAAAVASVGGVELNSHDGGGVKRKGVEQRRRSNGGGGKSKAASRNSSSGSVTLSSRAPSPMTAPNHGKVGASPPPPPHPLPLPLPLPLPEIQPPSWIADCDAIECKDCSTPFSFQVRRHHCRNCGQVFCHRCCRERLRLPHLRYKGSVRVCKECEAQVLALRQHCPELILGT